MGGDEDAASTVELNLGLSVGLTSPALTYRREKDAFRRRETRRKQEKKHMGKAQAPAAGDIRREDYGRSPPRFSAAPISVRHPNSSAAVGYAAAAIPVVPMDCSPPAWQYVPCGGRMYALPYVVPCWTEPAVDSERRVAGQVAAVGVPVVGKGLASVSKSCSDAAEFLSISRKGTFGRSNSSSSKETKSESNLTNAAAGDSPKPPLQSHALPQPHLPSSENLLKNAMSTAVKLLPPKLQREESRTAPANTRKKGADEGPEKREIVQKIPCVAARGDGPEGRTITGFLYRYTVEDVSIMCVCHGRSFSPAEFLRHAGCSETTQPLRHIMVVPMPAKS